MRRGWITTLIVAGALAGCSTDGGDESRSAFTVYVSVPLSGPAAAQGRAIRDGARLAARDVRPVPGDAKVSIRFLDDTRGGLSWSPASSGANARRAISDSASVAYVGELASGATRISVPITNGGELVQISPTSAANDLVSPFPGSDEVPEHVQPSGQRSFGRVIPDDEVQAETGAAWARKLGARTVAAVSDGSRYGEAMVDEFADEAESDGIAVRRGAARRADLVYYGGADPAVALRSLRRTDAPLIATDALLDDRGFLSRLGPMETRVRLTSSAQDPSQLPPPRGPRFVRRYQRGLGRPARPRRGLRIRGELRLPST